MRKFIPAVVLVFALGGCGEDKKLKVTGIEPSTGAFEGGTRVRIKGNRFTKDGSRAATVYFGQCSPRTENCKKGDVLGFRGDSVLEVKTPGGAPNEKVDLLIIFEPGGEITLKQAFTYVETQKADVEDLDIKKENEKK